MFNKIVRFLPGEPEKKEVRSDLFFCQSYPLPRQPIVGGQLLNARHVLFPGVSFQDFHYPAIGHLR